VTVLRPLAAPAAIAIDPDTRTVIVRPAPEADSYARILWREGHSHLARTHGTLQEETMWANIPGHLQVAAGQPGREGTVRFQLQPDDYRRLTSTRNLRAMVVVDRDTSRILNVSFRSSGVT